MWAGFFAHLANPPPPNNKQNQSNTGLMFATHGKVGKKSLSVVSDSIENADAYLQPGFL